MPINLKRSESLKSERSDASQKRVSFNKSVHVKRIPRGAVLDNRGRVVAIIPDGVDSLEAAEPQEIYRVTKAEPDVDPEVVVKEAAEILRKVDKLTCSTSPSPFVNRSRTEEDPQPQQAGTLSYKKQETLNSSNRGKMAQVIRPSDGYRRPMNSRSLAGLKPASTSLQQGFASSNRMRSRSEDTSQVLGQPQPSYQHPGNNYYENQQMHHQHHHHPFDESPDRGRSSSPPPYHKMKPAAHVNALVQRFNDQARRRREQPDTASTVISSHSSRSPERLVTPANSNRTHNANQPFSYLAPSSPTLTTPNNAPPPPAPVLPPSLASPHSSHSSPAHHHHHHQQQAAHHGSPPSSAGSRDSPEPVGPNLRSPHEVIYAQVAVNGRNKKTTVHRRFDGTGTGTDSQEESVRMGPSTGTRVSAANNDVTAHKYHLNDHPTYNEIKVSEKHRGSADWNEFYHPQQHSPGDRSRDPSPRGPGVFTIKSTDRSGAFRTDVYSRESSPESSFIQPTVARTNYNTRYSKNQDEEKWNRTSSGRDLNEIRGAGDGMEWKRIEYEKPMDTGHNVSSKTRTGGKNVSRVMLHAEAPIDVEPQSQQPTAPTRARGVSRTHLQHSDVGHDGMYYYGSGSKTMPEKSQRYYNSMARDMTPPKHPGPNQNVKYASVGRKLSPSGQPVRRDPSIRYVEREDPPARPNPYAVPMEKNKEIVRKPSLKKERSSMFNTLERLKGKLRKPLSELRSDFKQRNQAPAPPPGQQKGNKLASTELVRKAETRDNRTLPKSGPILPTGPPSTRESTSGLSKKSRKVKITFEHNPTRTDSDIENLRGFTQYKGPEIKGEGHVVKIEIKGDDPPDQDVNHYQTPQHRHHRVTSSRHGPISHSTRRSPSPIRPPPPPVGPPPGDGKLLRSRDKFMSAFLGPGPRSKSHERYATPPRKVPGGPQEHHQQRHHSPHRMPEGQAAQVPSSYDEDDDVRPTYHNGKNYGRIAGAPTDSDECDPVDPRMNPGSSATLRTTRRPSYPGKTGSSGSSPAGGRAMVHANTVDYRRVAPGRDKNAIYQPWTMGRVKPSNSTRNLNAADPGRSVHYSSHAIDMQGHPDYAKRQVTGESSSASEQSNRGRRRETRLKRSTSSAASLAYNGHGGSRHQLYQKPQQVQISSESDGGGGGHGPGSQASRPSGSQSQSSRSVYLHAAAVADIPPGGALRGAAARSARSSSLSQEDLLSKPGSLKRSRAVTRSLSLLAPWRPRHPSRDEMEVEYNYDSHGQTPGAGAGAGRPPRPPRRKNSPAAPHEGPGSGGGQQQGPAPPRTFSAKVQRHQSMPKDSKLAGWFKKKQQPAPASPNHPRSQQR